MASSDEYQSKRDILVRRLREAILRGDYEVGDRLRQEEVAERYGASPTPVREALRILEAQGLVRYSPNRGVAVADYTGTVRQLYRLREALECLATEMAVERMTPERAARLAELAAAMTVAHHRGDVAAREAAHTEFHLVLYGGCDFPALEAMIHTVWSRFPWTELLSVPGIPSDRDHAQIAELAGRGDAKATAEALRQHLGSVPEFLTASVAGRKRAADAPLPGAGNDLDTVAEGKPHVVGSR